MHKAGPRTSRTTHRVADADKPAVLQPCPVQRGALILGHGHMLAFVSESDNTGPCRWPYATKIRCTLLRWSGSKRGQKRVYGGRMLDLGRLDLEEIATALEDQTDYEHRWLINPQTGEVVFWTTDGGLDGHTPVDLDDLDLVGIDPLPSYVWYQDMADFAERISDAAAGRRLARAIQGKGAFRRFKNELHEEYPHLLPAWNAFRDVRAKRRAVDWLIDNSLVDDETGERFVAEHPDPDLP